MASIGFFAESWKQKPYFGIRACILANALVRIRLIIDDRHPFEKWENLKCRNFRDGDGSTWLISNPAWSKDSMRSVFNRLYRVMRWEPIRFDNLDEYISEDFDDTTRTNRVSIVGNLDSRFAESRLSHISRSSMTPARSKRFDRFLDGGDVDHLRKPKHVDFSVIYQDLCLELDL